MSFDYRIWIDGYVLVTSTEPASGANRTNPLKHSKYPPARARHKSGQVVCGLQSCAGSCDVGISP
jgi:hypothetical protein